jgi:hypothetical protein
METAPGVMSVPFKNKYLKVQFQNARVNKSRIVTSGIVRGVDAPVGAYADLQLDTIILGEDRFCKPVPEETGFDENGNNAATNLPWDEFGFNQNGQYVKVPPYEGWQDGDPYDPATDPYGFDTSGINVVTGTLYNEYGCSQQHLNADGQPCNLMGEPYAHLATGTTQAGIALANAVKDTLRPIVVVYLDSHLAATILGITAKQIECNKTRDTMNTHYGELGYSTDSRPFLYGPDDDWYKEGMYKSFERVPTTIQIATDRNVHEVELERLHVRLFTEDVALAKLLATKDIIHEIKVDPELTMEVDRLRTRIKRFTTQEAEQYKTIPALKVWVGQQMDSTIQGLPISRVPENGIGYTEPRKFQKLDNRINFASSLASADPNFPVFAPNEADIRFEYLQGWPTVNGVDRAFYLEAIANMMAENPPIDPNDPAHYLPIKITKEIAGKSYAIYIDNVEFTTTSAKADVYFILNASPSPDRIVFKALGVAFNTGGFLGAKLALGTNVSITLSNPMRLNLFGNNNTYVKFDCDGFAGMGIDAELEFCRRYVVPLDPVTLKPMPDPKTVKARIQLDIPAWGMFTVKLNIPPFAVTGHEDVTFSVQEVTLDFDEAKNPDNILFPPNYKSAFVNNNQASPLWKGVYIKQITATLPPAWKRTSGAPVVVGVQNMIFDDMGLTGKIFAANLITLCEGNLDGWAFSLDTFGIAVICNRFTGVNIAGW